MDLTHVEHKSSKASCELNVDLQSGAALIETNVVKTEENSPGLSSHLALLEIMDQEQVSESNKTSEIISKINGKKKQFSLNLKGFLPIQSSV